MGRLIRETHLKSFTSSLAMKSRHSGEIPAKHSSSKSYLAMVTFDIVSMSFSPMNGDRPEMLLLLFHVCVCGGAVGRVGCGKVNKHEM